MPGGCLGCLPSTVSPVSIVFIFFDVNHQLMVKLVVWNSKGTLYVTIPFIFGDPRIPNHRAPNHPLTIS